MVPLERLLRAHGLGRGEGLDGAIVDPARQLAEQGPARAEAGCEHAGGDGGELADGPDPHGVEIGGGDAADAPQA